MSSPLKSDQLGPDCGWRVMSTAPGNSIEKGLDLRKSPLRSQGFRGRRTRANTPPHVRKEVKRLSGVARTGFMLQSQIPGCRRGQVARGWEDQTGGSPKGSQNAEHGVLLQDRVGHFDLAAALAAALNVFGIDASQELGPLQRISLLWSRRLGSRRLA